MPSFENSIQLEQGILVGHRKSDLPEKICPVCERPFQWRKKWAKDWDEVKFCSDRCRRSKSFLHKAADLANENKGD